MQFNVIYSLYSLASMRFRPDRVTQARLAADMSRADLAFAVRALTGGDVKASERSVRGWEKGEYQASGTAVAAIAKATGHDIEFFYESGGEDDEEEEAALPANLIDALAQQLARRLLQKTEAKER